jgi:NitT/TauT family transport system substrate-binding protein
MTSIIGRRQAIVVGAGLFGATMARAQTAGAVRTIKEIHSLPTLTSALPYLATAAGLDRKHGLAFDIQSAGGSSTLQVDAVLAGSAFFGSPGTATALQAIREGADLKILASIANNQIAAVINNEALKKIGVSPDAPIGERIKAMKGMTIGTNPIGATYYQMFRTYLQQYGLNPDRDVRLVGMGDSMALVTGIQQNRFDAIVSASGIVEQAIGLGAATMWFSGARGDMPGQDSTMVIVIVARSDTLVKEPEMVKTYLTILQEALDMIRLEHAKAGKLLKDNFFQKFDAKLWDMVWDNAKAAYPNTLAFTRRTFDYWLENDPKGPASYKNVDYAKITYGPAQSA